MNADDKTLLTYSLLAQLRDNSNNPSLSLINLFIPIIKKAISDLCELHDDAVLRGKDCSEIHDQLVSQFGLDIPVPILRDCILNISVEINDTSTFQAFSDGGYIIHAFRFEDLNEDIDNEREDLDVLRADFESYCQINNEECDFDALIEFVRAQQLELFSDKQYDILDLSYHIPKYVKEKVADTKIFSILTKIYVGGIIADYFCLKISKPVTKTELLVDTNYVISLLNLNTEDAFNTCRQLHDLCQTLGFRFSILYSTVAQIKILLSNRIENFENKVVLGSVKGNDIFAACIRRGLQVSDLYLIKDNIENKLEENHISIISEAQVSSLEREAKKSDRYKHLVEIRQNNASALHDAMAELYVQKKRGNENLIKSFPDVSCWFLHNSQKSYDGEHRATALHKRLTICADELLTMLWLSNPAQSASISCDIIAQSGLSTYITRYRATRRPSTKIVIELRDRLYNLRNSGLVNEKDIYNLTTRMAEGVITNEDAISMTSMQDEQLLEKIKQFEQQEDAKNRSRSTQALDNRTLRCQMQQMKEGQLYLKKKIAQFEFEKRRDAYVQEKMQKIISHYHTSVTIYMVVIMIIVFGVLFKSHLSSLQNCCAHIGIVADIVGIVLVVIPLFMRFANHEKLWKAIKYVFCPYLRKQIENEIRQQLEDEYKTSHADELSNVL